MRVLLALALCLVAGQVEAANLCVSETGNDSTPKATIFWSGSELGSTCWRTIGRAAWGSTDRSSPNASEAAEAGDTVYVLAGTYTSALVLDNRFSVLYNPTNEGTAGNPIRFSAVGDVTIECEDCESAAIGSSGRDYIEWYADVSLGYSWVLVMCAQLPGGGPDTCPAGTVAITPDTGPVICQGGIVECHLEGLVISGYAPAVYSPVDNFPGVRFEGCDDCSVRNSSFRDIRISGAPDNGHGIAVQLYDSERVIVEHIHVTDCGGGVFMKDKASMTQRDNIVRYNRFDNVSEVFGLRHVTGSGSVEDASHWYQNVINGCVIAISVTGATHDIFSNNTIYGCTTAVYQLYDSTNVSGVRIWNNIGHSPARHVAVEGAAMQADTVEDLEHNVHYNPTTVHYVGTDGTRSFASYLAAFSDQDQASPASIATDPGLVDAAGGDFRVCTASGVPHASCSGAGAAVGQGVDLLDLDNDGSTVDLIPAGAYITNDEVIGIESTAASSGRLPRLLRRLRL